MYDWPEVRAETDALWAVLRDALRERGLDAPEALDRDTPLQALWRDPALCLAQTCGLPFRLGLHEHVALVGTPDHGVEGCAPGFYCSVLVARKDDTRPSFAAFAGAVAAFNAPDSQSGWAALAAAAEGASFFARRVETGSHRASIRAVASGEAAIAAIDAVTWRLALRHEPAARALRVLGRTAPVPGLPLVTAGRHDPAPYAAAARQALASPEARALGIAGLVAIPKAAYLALTLPPAP